MQTPLKERRSLFRVGTESSWTTVLPVTFIIVSLLSLVILPVVVSNHTAVMRREISAVAEPARIAASSIQINLAGELDNIIGYQVTGQAQYGRYYLEALADQEKNSERLRRLAPQLKGATAIRLNELLAATARWHREAKQAEFLARVMPSPVFTTRLFERHPAYEKSLQAAADLQMAIQAAIDQRLQKIRDAEKINFSLTLILTLLALSSSLMVAGLGRQMRLLAREAMHRRREAELEAVEAKIARAAAEKQERRSTFLATGGRELTSSLDYEHTIASLAHLVVPNLAELALLDLVNGSDIARVAVAHRDPKKEERLRDSLGELQISPPELFLEVMNVREPRILHDPAQVLAAIVGLDSHDESGSQYGSLLLVPLVSRGQTLGVLTLAANRDRTFSEDDSALAAELARHAALAIDNARLYLESQQAVRAREEVLAIVSHDLRNPLGAITLSASFARSQPIDDPDLAEQLEVIELSAKRMSRLIEDLLDVTRMEGGKALPIEPGKLEIDPLFREVHDIFKPQATAAGVTIEYSIPASAPLLYADRHRIMQVLSNLVGNALKFTPAGGLVSYRAEVDGVSVRFTVSDSGPGIPAENLTDIFNPYWQAKRTARLGAGLGLPIAKGIVEAHGGRIWVESPPGAGASFFFTLPVFREP